MGKNYKRVLTSQHFFFFLGGTMLYLNREQTEQDELQRWVGAGSPRAEVLLASQHFLMEEKEHALKKDKIMAEIFLGLEIKCFKYLCCYLLKCFNDEHVKKTKSKVHFKELLKNYILKFILLYT